jgi:hypothetical protein
VEVDVWRTEHPSSTAPDAEVEEEGKERRNDVADQRTRVGDI